MAIGTQRAILPPWSTRLQVFLRRVVLAGVLLASAVSMPDSGASPVTAPASVDLASEDQPGRVWVVAVGISEYAAPAIRDLRFARTDAVTVADYYRQRFDLPPGQVLVRLDTEASLRELKRLLGTELVAKANRPADTVVIFFAGHGKKEPDIGSQDLDGFSKYLLPYDADPDDLFGSALGMEDLVRILQRLPAERVVMVLDTCFSGAVGGARSLFDPTEPIRSGATEEFLERLAASGRGRVVLTAASVDEPAFEHPELGHGIFTYYLLAGLGGTADDDRDGGIDVDELYKFVFRQVTKFTEGKQNPVKKAPNLVGSLVVGRSELEEIRK